MTPAHISPDLSLYMGEEASSVRLLWPNTVKECKSKDANYQINRNSPHTYTHKVITDITVGQFF